MDDAVRQTLMQLCDELGVSLLQDPERLEAHLRDLIPGRNAEIHCLSMAVREGVVSDLLSASDALPTDVLVARLSDRLHERMAMDPAAARWAVESLAQAVGRPHAGAPAKVALGTALAPRVDGRPAGSASASARAAEAIDARWACTACRQLNHRDLRFCGYCGTCQS